MGAFSCLQSVLFKLVVRNDKNKPQVRDLAVPVHTNIAKSSLVALEERDIEREKLKQRVLQHHESQKEEEAQHGSEFHIRVRSFPCVALVGQITIFLRLPNPRPSVWMLCRPLQAARRRFPSPPGACLSRIAFPLF